MNEWLYNEEASAAAAAAAAGSSGLGRKKSKLECVGWEKREEKDD